MRDRAYFYRGGVSSWMINALIPGDWFMRSSGRNILTCMSPPVENPACAAFKEYGEVPEMVPLNFTEDDVTCRCVGSGGD